MRALLCLLLLLPACGERASLPGCPARRDADGTYTLPVGDACEKGVRIRVRVGGAFVDDPGLRLEWRAGAGGGALRLSSMQPGVEAFWLTLGPVPATAILQQGYQSWSFAGALVPPATVPRDADGAPSFLAARSGDAGNEVAGASSGMVVALGPGRAVVLGALAAEHATTGLAATGADGNVTLEVVYGAAREVLPAAGGATTTEPLWIGTASEAQAALSAYAEALAASLAAAGARQPRRPPGGWFTWNERFAAIDEEFVKANASVVARELAPRGLPLVEIDDGWARAWGDWRENERFPSGLPALAAELAPRGLTLGVWLAPFLVDVDSEVARSADPSLFLRGANGAPLRHVPSGGARSYYVLDGTQPAAMRIPADAIRRLRDGGFRFFKLDFLYAGAIAGGRADAAATGVEALRRGLAVLREAMGEDSVFNACGAPVFPVLGLADSLRVGPDTAFERTPLGWPIVAAAARGHAARAFLALPAAGPIVWPDADQVQLRAPYTEDAARAGAIVAALSGAAYSLGDDLTTLDPARLALGLSEDVLAFARARRLAQPTDLLSHPAEDVVVTPAIEVLITPDATAAAPPAAFSALGMGGERLEASFDWTAQKVSVRR